MAINSLRFHYNFYWNVFKCKLFVRNNGVWRECNCCMWSWWIMLFVYLKKLCIFSLYVLFAVIINIDLGEYSFKQTASNFVWHRILLECFENNGNVYYILKFTFIIGMISYFFIDTAIKSKFIIIRWQRIVFKPLLYLCVICAYLKFIMQQKKYY